MKREEGGFTLIEVLVALTILSLGITALTQTVRDSSGRLSRSRGQMLADNFAANMLVRLGRDSPVRNGLSTGDDGRLRWRLLIEPYGSDADRAAWPIAVSAVTLTVSWEADGLPRRSEWHTLKPAETGPA